MQSEAEKTRRQRTKTCTWRRPIYCTNPATKSRARSLARSQSCRIPTRNSARSVSRPAKTIHASRRYLQKKQPRRRKPVPSRRLVPLTKSGTGFSVRPLARRDVSRRKAHTTLGSTSTARFLLECLPRARYLIRSRSEGFKKALSASSRKLCPKNLCHLGGVHPTISVQRPSNSRAG